MNGNEELNPIDTGPLLEFSAVKVWFFALFLPTVPTFERLLADPRAGTKRAVLWFVGFSILNASILVLEPFLLRGIISWDLIVISIFMSLFFSALFIFFAAITEMFAELMSGEGDFSKLLFGFATFGAPMTTILVIQDLVPFIAIIRVLTVVYCLVLGHLACKAVHQFRWKKVFISLAPITIGAIIFAGFAAIL